MDRRFTDHGSISDLPWTTVFDPAANATVLSAIQAQGFRAATQLVDRFVGVSSQSNGSAVNGTESTDAELILTSWWSLFGRLLRSMPGVGGLPGSGTGIDLANGTASGGVDLTVDDRGVATGEIWLHNSAPVDVERVRLRCSDLLAHDGSVVGAGAIRFSPAAFAVPGRSSRGIAVEVAVNPVATPARYRGTILAEGYPDLWLPVTVILRAQSQ